ncbi:hypothetical protein HDU96_010684 [Phlyctochytrium bullatum]|nr:hypothetical protein HDU96_010684 [Phlyctochytrium bullatum]
MTPIADSPSTQTLDLLPAEVLRNILLYVHPNDLPALGAANRRLWRMLPACLDSELAKRHLWNPYYFDPSDRYRRQVIRFDHPLLFTHMVEAIAIPDMFEPVFLYQWEKRWRTDVDELRLGRVAAIRTAVQKDLWPSPQAEGFQNDLHDAIRAAGILKSLDLLADLRSKFPNDIPDDLDTHPHRLFFYASAKVGFAEALATIPANHPILFSRESHHSPMTLLEAAVEASDVDSVRILFDLGAVADDDFRDSMALENALYSGNSELLQVLREQGVPAISRRHKCLDHEPPGPYFKTRATALHRAARKGNLIYLRMLLSLRSNPNARDDFGCTPLHEAARKNRVNCIHALLDAGADINLQSDSGATALYDACKVGSLEAVRVLVARGARADLLCDRTVPILYLTLYRKIPIEFVRLLLDAGADLAESDFYLLTTLHTALIWRRLDVAKVLLESGADPNWRCRGRQTALHVLAELYEWSDDVEELFELMVDRRVYLNAKNTSLNTALDLAAQYERKELLLRLLKTEGVNPHCGNGLGWQDEVRRNRALFDWLLEHNAELLEAGVDLRDFSLSEV